MIQEFIEDTEFICYSYRTFKTWFPRWRVTRYVPLDAFLYLKMPPRK